MSEPMSNYKATAEILQARYREFPPPVGVETAEVIGSAIEQIVELGGALDNYPAQSTEDDGYFGRRDQLMVAFRACQACNRELIKGRSHIEHPIVAEILALGGEYCCETLEKLGFGAPA